MNLILETLKSGQEHFLKDILFLRDEGVLIERGVIF
jgi:hypothetical protein